MINLSLAANTFILSVVTFGGCKESAAVALSSHPQSIQERAIAIAQRLKQKSNAGEEQLKRLRVTKPV